MACDGFVGGRGPLETVVPAQAAEATLPVVCDGRCSVRLLPQKQLPAASLHAMFIAFEAVEKLRLGRGHPLHARRVRFYMGKCYRLNSNECSTWCTLNGV